jgi:beta-lactam-binding protein with PASTA domain
MASRHCTSCEADSDSDFCRACGRYLAWDAPIPASTTERDRSPAEQPTVAAIRAPATVRMHVQVGDLDVQDPEALDALRLDAGSTLALTARVRNHTGIVDEFLVGVEGLPRDWVLIHPAILHLAPAGSREDVASDVAIAIRPPRASSTKPGRWRFAVTVSSGSPAAEHARVLATLTVQPFGGLELDARPKIATGRRGTSFACELRNVGNSPAVVSLLASDAAQACWFDIPAETRLEPGARGRLAVGVRPAKTLWIGRPVDHRVQIEASALPAGISAKAPPLIYRQRPWVPWWAPPLLVLLIAVAAVLYLALPREVTMPALIGAPSAFAAQQELSQAGLRGPSQITTEILATVAPGTIVGQAPHAGEHVSPSAPVILQVADAPATGTIVPDLDGLTPQQADSALARVHLKMGAISPALDPKAHIASQLPAPGSLREQGEPVDVVLAARTAKVPNLLGRGVRSAERLLSRDGLTLGSVTPAPGPGAKVRSQLPTPGVHAHIGSPVQIFVAQRTVIVPNVHGMPPSEADTALGICGLRLGPLPPSAKPSQVVAAEVPGLGSRQEEGTTVTVILGAKPKPGAGNAPTPRLPTPGQCLAS